MNGKGGMKEGPCEMNGTKDLGERVWRGLLTCGLGTQTDCSGSEKVGGKRGREGREGIRGWRKED